MKNLHLSTLDSYPEWGDAQAVGDAPTDLRLTVFQEADSEMSLYEMFFGKCPVNTAGGRAGSRSGQREKWSHNAGPLTAAADPAPWEALKLNGRSELSCFGSDGQAFIPLHRAT